MKYFLLPFILLIYFELLGRSFFAVIKKKPLEFSFVIGFVMVMAVTYLVGWPITAFNGNFYHLLILYGLLFVGSVVFIVINLKKIDWHFNWKWWTVFALLFAFQFYMSWTRTLGEVHGYDTLYYFNMVSFNISNSELNSLHPHFGTYPNTDIQWITYVFQSYYYVAAVYIYAAEKVFSLIGSSFEFIPGYYWTFQLMCNAVFISAGLISIKEIDSENRILNCSLAVLLVLFMNNFYWNNAFGYIGNNFRMSVHALCTIYLFRYVKEKDRINLCIALGLMTGMCGLSSTGTFAMIFLLFGLFFFLYDKEKDFFRIAAVFVAVPLINIAIVKLGQHFYPVIAVMALCVGVYLTNDRLLIFFRRKYARIALIVLVFAVLYGMSIYTSGKIIDLTYFFDNYSEIADMSWDYFYFPDFKHWLFNLILLGSMVFYFVRKPKDILTVISLVLIATFFNPLCSYFMNTINWVYYRCYDIIINQFTISLFLITLVQYINRRKTEVVSSLLILAASVYLAAVQIPCYWHPSFIPDEDYNYISKIENSELEIDRNICQMVNDLGLENPRIINHTFFMATFVPDGEYMYGKEKRFNYGQSDETDYYLYCIFFPSDGNYDFFKPADIPEYALTNTLLKESDYDILVISNDAYYESASGRYHALTELVEKEYVKSEYSTKDYSVYYLGQNR